MNHSQLFKQTIAAGGTVLVAATGTKLFVRTALQPFKVKFDNGAQIEVEDGFRFTSGDYLFSRLEITNPNAASLYIEFYVGDASVERDAPLYIRDAVTSIGPASGSTVMAAGALSAVYAAAPAGKHRKEVIIGNQNAIAGNELVIYIDIGTGFNPVAFVPAASSFVLPSNVPFKIYNNSAAAITVYVLELLYA